MNVSNQEKLQRVIKKRASRLGMSPEQLQARSAAQKPRYWKAAQERAAVLGVSAQKVLETDLRALLDSNYPTQECVMPFEIEEYQDLDKIPESRRDHIRDCIFCSSLMTLAEPNPEKLSEFMKAARRAPPQERIERGRCGCVQMREFGQSYG